MPQPRPFDQLPPAPDHRCTIVGRTARRILIIRPSAIGDVVMASPVLAVLRRHCPDSHLGWLVEPHIGELLKTNPALDQVIVWPKSAWRQLWRAGRWWQLLRELCMFARTLRRQQFDVALDLQGLLRSRLLAWLSGAPVRIGFVSKEPGGFLLTRRVSRGVDSPRMGSEYRHLMGELGFDPEPFHPCLEVGAAEQATAARALQAAGVSGRYAVFAPFTTRPQKHWDAGRWSELAERFAERFNLPAVILGGPADRDAADRLCAAAAGRAVSLAGTLSLVESMAVIRTCDLLVGVDTGLTHMGPAFDRPTVALFGATCPYRETSRANTTVLYHRHPCSPCRRAPTCDGRFPCMLAISVDEVVTACAANINASGGTA
jgi:heptosyltransferase-1